MVDVGLACTLYKRSKQKTTSDFVLYNTRPEAWSVFTPGVILQLQAGDQVLFFTVTITPDHSIHAV